MKSPSNLPILLIGYNRPELLTARLAEIDTLPIPRLYIWIDSTPVGPNPELLNVINEYESRNHNFEVRINVQSVNLGLTKHVTEAITQVLKQEEMVFVVEDDIQLSSVSYQSMCAGIKYMSELGTIGIVGGFSPLRKPEKKKTNYWRTTSYFSVWGWVATRQNWKNYKYDISGVNLERELAHSKNWKKLSDFQKSTWISRFERSQKDPLYTWDIQMQFWSFVYDFINILPMYRVVENLGFEDVRATHTNGVKPRWFRAADPRLFCTPTKRLGKIAKWWLNQIDSNTLFGDAWTFHYYSRKIRPVVKRQR